MHFLTNLHQERYQSLPLTMTLHHTAYSVANDIDVATQHMAII